jgi:hypothetical protein
MRPGGIPISRGEEKGRMGETEPNHYKIQEVGDEATESPSKLSDQGFNNSDRLSAQYKQDPSEQLNCNRELVGYSDDKGRTAKYEGTPTDYLFKGFIFLFP